MNVEVLGKLRDGFVIWVFLVRIFVAPKVSGVKHGRRRRLIR